MKRDETSRQARDGNSPAGTNPDASRLDVQTAIKWLLYEYWSIEEAANLLSGYMPEREMLQPGATNQQIDEVVLEVENSIRRAIGNPLVPIERDEYFVTQAFPTSELMAWAIRHLSELPEPLLAAYQHQQQQVRQPYTTPCLAAIEWTVEQYWANVNYRSPPSQGEIVQALLQQFPELDHEECIMVEYLCRHPLVKET